MAIKPEEMRKRLESVGAVAGQSIPKPPSTSETKKTVSGPMPTMQNTVPKPPTVGPTLSSSGSTTPRPTVPTSTVPKPPSVVAGPSAQAKYNTGTTTSQVPRPNNYVAPTDKNYVAHGGKDLNDLLYLKRTYETNPNNKGLQNYASTSAKDIYGRLGDQAAQFQAMNAQQLEDYILGLGGKETAIPQPIYPTTSEFPSFSYTEPTSDPIAPTEPAIPVMDWEALQKYVDGQLSAELVRQRSAADQAINAGKLTAEQQVAALRQAAERLRGDMTEQRGIENVENSRRLSPFSGRSDFAQGMIERERGKTDRQLAENQQMQEANIQGNLAQLQNEINAKYLALQQTQGAERERMLQSLRESERQYDMQLAELEINRQIANSNIKNTDFNQDLASWQANRGAYEFDKNFSLNEGQLTGRYQGTPTLAAQQFAQDQKNANWGAYMDMVNQTGNLGTGPKSDWSQLASGAYGGQQTLAGKQFQEQIRQAGVDEALKRAGLSQDAQQFAASMGLNWAQLSQQQKEFAANEIWKQKNYDLDWAKLTQPSGTTDPYDKLMSEALAAAQKEPMWPTMSQEQRQQTIDYYAQLLAPQQAGGMSDSDILKYLK